MSSFLRFMEDLERTGPSRPLLEVAGVAYTGSNRLGCSLAMDKEVSKRLLRQAGSSDAGLAMWRMLSLRKLRTYIGFACDR